MLVVLFGAQTRLARALLRLPQMRRHDLLLVARHEEEARILTSRIPRARILRVWRDDPPPVLGADRVAILACALGVIHPGESHFSAELGDAERDVGVLERLTRAYAALPLRVVLVSSVVALAPARARASYGGWKSVLEGAVASIVAASPQGSLAVVYPGRLVERREVSRPGTLLASRYQNLAAWLLRAALRDDDLRATHGWDARLWLAARGGALALQGLRGSR